MNKIVQDLGCSGFGRAFVDSPVVGKIRAHERAGLPGGKYVRMIVQHWQLRPGKTCAAKCKTKHLFVMQVLAGRVTGKYPADFEYDRVALIDSESMRALSDIYRATWLARVF